MNGLNDGGWQTILESAIALVGIDTAGCVIH